MKYKNMKIEINESQPFNEIVKELERLGYQKRKAAIFKNTSGSYLVTRSYGIITWCCERLVDLLWSDCNEVTLSYIKAMK